MLHTATRIRIRGPSMDNSKHKPLTPFHLAIKVHDLVAARAFYGEMLGCPEGRSDISWVDFNLMGHQLVCHLGAIDRQPHHTNPVDGHDVPVPHFGVVLTMSQWQELAARLEAAEMDFVIDPHVRFAGKAGEQATMFFLDPSGNALEFKAFGNIAAQLFESD